MKHPNVYITAEELKAQENIVAYKTYEALQLQIWSLLPGFCTRPTDLAEVDTVNESVHKETTNLGFRPGLTQTGLVQSQKKARSLKFWIYKEEGLYYLCNENKGAVQLCSFFTADLCLCFCLCILLVFSCYGSVTHRVFGNSLPVGHVRCLGQLFISKKMH